MSLTLTALLAAGLAPLPNVPVADLDLKRYSGQWHEVAHLPMFFQRNCVDQVTATYTPLANGRIRVDNACRDVKGKTLRSIGVARKVAGKPGQLEVRFVPGWLSWVPMVWADYWVVDLDARHVERWTPERETPHVDRATLTWSPREARSALTIELPPLFAKVHDKARWVWK